MQGPTEGITAYVAAMTELYDRNIDMTTADLVEYLHGNLKPRFKDHIPLQQVHTEEDILLKGLALERLWRVESLCLIVTGEEKTPDPEAITVDPETVPTSATTTPFPLKVVTLVDEPVLETFTMELTATTEISHPAETFSDTEPAKPFVDDSVLETFTMETTATTEISNSAETIPIPSQPNPCQRTPSRSKPPPRTSPKVAADVLGRGKYINLETKPRADSPTRPQRSGKEDKTPLSLKVSGYVESPMKQVWNHEDHERQPALEIRTEIPQSNRLLPAEAAPGIVEAPSTSSTPPGHQ
ncbi:hypothetical protein FQA39_LY01112 [Lamprigera yunnana]|nr:hypothetical protein FQA39_LY01112 [Lamprigera yunnana]